MATILVVYATTEGHTRKIAEEIGNQVHSLGHAAAVKDSSASDTGRLHREIYDAVIVCGSVHQGKHQAALVHWVKANREELQRTRTAFVSVSLAAAMVEAGGREQAQEYVSDFLLETAWTPDETAPVAGALLYSKYDFFKRLVMKLIALSRGGDTDTSQDYEYTDWDQLRWFVSRFIGRVAAPKSPDPNNT